MECPCDTQERARAIALGLPPEAVVLAEASTECNLVYRLGDTVYKLYKAVSVIRNQIPRRAELAKEYPDLIVHTTYDPATGVGTQPFIEGRPATAEEAIKVEEGLALEGEMRVRDVTPQNLIIQNDGKPKLIDFAIGAGERLRPGVTVMKGRGRAKRVILVGGVTAEQKRSLGPIGQVIREGAPKKQPRL